MSATVWSIYRMLKHLPELHESGYTLHADNWFSSVATAIMCKKMGVEYVGTVRSDRLLNAFGTKEEIKAATKGWKRGDARSKKCTVDGFNLYVTQWMDSKSVYMISTMPTVMGTKIRKMNEQKNYDPQAIARSEYVLLL